MIARNDFNFGLQVEGTYSITQEDGSIYINSDMVGNGLTFSNNKLGSIFNIFNFRTVISTGYILDIFNNPYELIPAQGPGIIIVPISIQAQMIYNTTPYAGDGEIDFYCGGNRPVFGLPADDGFLFGTVTRIVNGVITHPFNTTDTQYVDNQPLTIKTVGSNPINGDSDIIIFGTYQLIDIS